MTTHEALVRTMWAHAGLYPQLGNDLTGLCLTIDANEGYELRDAVVESLEYLAEPEDRTDDGGHVEVGDTTIYWRHTNAYTEWQDSPFDE